MRTDDIEARILAMYQKGMSVRDIEDHVRDIYGVDASPGLISRITDKIMPELIDGSQDLLQRFIRLYFLMEYFIK